MKVNQAANVGTVRNYEAELTNEPNRSQKVDERLAYLGLVALLRGEALAQAIDDGPGETFPDPRPNPEPENPNAPTVVGE